MRDLKFIQACPDDAYYTWQVHMWLESLRNIGQSDKAISLIFTPKNREVNPKWKQVMDLYPEAEFHFYKDVDNVSDLLGIYIPILRPYVLWKHFKAFPELSEKAIFYCDSDILFTKDFNVDQFLEDEICYLSDTNSYINASYFDSKVHQVLPEKLEDYKNRDVLGELTSVIGINREICEANNLNSGGAQYLLKNVDAYFWSKVMNDCIIIRTYLQNINREYFKDENSGYQSWCADMWAVLWNLWARGQETKVVKELDFAWATDPISRLETTSILHNAGIAATQQNGHSCFYKGKYHMGSDPTKDHHLNIVLNDEKAKQYCTWHYANELKKLSNKYNLNY